MNRPINLLIVEDEVMSALFYKKIFTKLGFQVVKTVSTGQEAVSFAVNGQVDAILMDITLIGKMNGIEAAAEILSVKQIPIVFVTGYDDDENRQQAEKLNPVGYYIKPISLDQIEEIIRMIKKELKDF